MKTQEVPLPTIPATAADAGRREHETAPRPRPEPTFLQVFTLVLWLTCLVVGLLGLWLQHRLVLPRLAPTAKPQPPPMHAELIDVELTREPVVMAAADSPPPPPPDAPALPPNAPPPAPALPAVAAPSPAIAFAVPVEDPVRIVPAARAAAAAPVRPVPRPAVEHLVYGQGTAAAQPKPEYPSEALAAHQEGVVGIAFTVAPGGRVIEAHVAEPCPWPTLNQAALAVVRDEWANSQWVPGHPYLVRLRYKINEL